jgi:hypothetical protein
LQTLVLLGGIAAALVAWGYTLSGLQRDTDRNSDNVAKLLIRMEENDHKTDLNEARIDSLEKVAADAILLRRQLEGTLGEFKSDIAVIKEILERMDREEKNKP